MTFLPFKVADILGRSHRVQPGDVIGAKRALARLGHYRVPTWGVTPWPDDALFGGLAQFQRQHGLSPDGVMRPSGPTERALDAALSALGQGPGRGEREDAGSAAPPAATRERLFDVEGAVGLGRPNRPADIVPLKHALALTGHYRDGDPEQPVFDLPLLHAIRAFQKDAGVTEDGWLGPKGETARALDARVAPLVYMSEQAEAEIGGPAGTRRLLKHVADNTDAESAPMASKPSSSDVEAAGRAMGRYERTFKNLGWDRAAGHLKHFLEGSGEKIIYSREQAREFPTIAKAEAENKKRFVAGTFVGETIKNETPRKLKTMKDGESIEFEDGWDLARSASKMEDAHQFLHPDSYFAHGDTQVSSQGKFRATRQGNEIKIDGIVTHSWSDTYNFHNGQPGHSEATVLENSGRARPYQIESQWQEHVSGTVRIDRGRLVADAFQWRDIDP